jgi:hypothetical protein
MINLLYCISRNEVKPTDLDPILQHGFFVFFIVFFTFLHFSLTLFA